jgi:hypothetical protein
MAPHRHPLCLNLEMGHLVVLLGAGRAGSALSTMRAPSGRVPSAGLGRPTTLWGRMALAALREFFDKGMQRCKEHRCISRQGPEAQAI